jgi:hypothetical protein
MKIKEAHFVNGHPPQVVRFGIRFVCASIGSGVGNYGVVTPVAMVIRKDRFEFKMLRLDSCFFMRLTRSRSNRIFVRIKRATRQRPGASAVGPCGSQLKKDTWSLKVGAH